MGDQRDSYRYINSPVRGAVQPVVFGSDSGYNVEDLKLFQRYKFHIFYTRFAYVENWLP
jgi:hypothetical protein